jgi:uncharacterized protein (DUF1778 family)
MPKPKKIGRPKLTKEEMKTKIVPVRFDPEDFKIVTAAAKAENQTLSAWIRHVLRTAAELEMFDGTLHEAMQIVLREREFYAATIQELNIEIERRRLYVRRDGDAARAKQINARVRKYPGLFEFAAPGIVRLVRISPPNVE